MKKLIAASLIALMCFAGGLAWAGEINQTLISTTILNADPVAASGTINVQDFKKVGFWVSYAETEVGNSISLAVTITVSYDGTNFVAGNFLDVTGALTPQSSETISADGWYYFFLDASWPFKYVKVILTATNTDADDLASVACYVVGSK